MNFLTKYRNRSELYITISSTEELHMLCTYMQSRYVMLSEHATIRRCFGFKASDIQLFAIFAASLERTIAVISRLAHVVRKAYQFL